MINLQKPKTYQAKELRKAIDSHNWNYPLPVKFGESKHLNISKETLEVLIQRAEENNRL